MTPLEFSYEVKEAEQSIFTIYFFFSNFLWNSFAFAQPIKQWSSVMCHSGLQLLLQLYFQACWINTSAVHEVHDNKVTLLFNGTVSTRFDKFKV